MPFSRVETWQAFKLNASDPISIRRRNRSALGVEDAFTYNVTKPTKSNTGLPPNWVSTGTINGDINITTPGTTLYRKVILGNVKISTSNVSIIECDIRGNSNVGMEGSLVDCRPGGCVNALIERCRLRMDYPSWNVGGIMGHDFTAKRNSITVVNDGFGLYRTQNTATGTPLNVQILGNYVGELAWFTGQAGVVHPSDTKTHNDCVQIQGGDGAILRGNTFDAFLSTDPSVGTQDYPTPYANACIQLNSNAGLTSNVIYEYNWNNGGAIMCNLPPVPVNTGTYNFNKFGRDCLYKSSGIPRTLVFAGASVEGVDFTQRENRFDVRGDALDNKLITVFRG